MQTFYPLSETLGKKKKILTLVHEIEKIVKNYLGLI